MGARNITAAGTKASAHERFDQKPIEVNRKTLLDLLSLTWAGNKWQCELL